MHLISDVSCINISNIIATCYMYIHDDELPLLAACLPGELSSTVKQIINNLEKIISDLDEYKLCFPKQETQRILRVAINTLRYEKLTSDLLAALRCDVRAAFLSLADIEQTLHTLTSIILCLEENQIASYRLDCPPLTYLCSKFLNQHRVKFNWDEDIKRLPNELQDKIKVCDNIVSKLSAS